MNLLRTLFSSTQAVSVKSYLKAIYVESGVLVFTIMVARCTIQCNLYAGYTLTFKWEAEQVPYTWSPGRLTLNNFFHV